VIAAGVLLHSLFAGEPAPANPWGAATLEWHTTSPPPHDNFETQPIPGDPYDVDRWVFDREAGGYVLAPSGAAGGRV
jgi:cytochrome c oxidase subunit 1